LGRPEIGEKTGRTVGEVICADGEEGQSGIQDSFLA
jgi:hypothetical protein